jgi:hypothetical protein
LLWLAGLVELLLLLLLLLLGLLMLLILGFGRVIALIGLLHDGARLGDEAVEQAHGCRYGHWSSRVYQAGRQAR